MKKKKGFTLIELLGVIAILAIIFTIGTYFATNIINSSKEKSYKITINNIENHASNYMLENNDKIFYIATNYEDSNDNKVENTEYQCITIQNLIEYGYFKSDILNSDVSKDRKVLKDDYVYIKRDADTKVILESKYLVNNDEINKLCEKAVNAFADISINYTPSEWSTEKTVSLKYKIKNYSNLYDYSYHYDFDGGNVEVVEDLGSTKILKVFNEGNFSGHIKENGIKINPEKSIKIDKIDRDAPSIDFNKISDTTKEVKKKIHITISDNESGLKQGGVLEYGWSNSNIKEPTYKKVNFDYEDGTNEINYSIEKTGLMGVHYLWIKVNISDIVGNNLKYDNVLGGYEFIYQFKVNISADAGISSVSGNGLHTVGEKVTISAVPKEFYKLDKWTGYANSDKTSYTFIMPEQDVDFNVNSKKYKCDKGTLTNDSNKGYICIDSTNTSVGSSTGCEICKETKSCITSSSGCGYNTTYTTQCPQAGTCREETIVCKNKSCSVYEWGIKWVSCTKWYECEKTKYVDAPCYGTCTEEKECNCSTSYYCKSGWNTYSGSGRNLECYKNAST